MLFCYVLISRSDTEWCICCKVNNVENYFWCLHAYKHQRRRRERRRRNITVTVKRPHLANPESMSIYSVIAIVIRSYWAIASSAIQCQYWKHSTGTLMSVTTWSISTEKPYMQLIEYSCRPIWCRIIIDMDIYLSMTLLLSFQSGSYHFDSLSQNQVSILPSKPDLTRLLVIWILKCVL